MTECILKITDLVKSFGGIYASDHINLAVEQGACHAIIGPNGAGKTTLISQITGQLKADAGCIHFNGKEISNRNVAQRARAGLARSFQITSVLQPLTLRENVMLAMQAQSGHSFAFWTPAFADQNNQIAAMDQLRDVGLEAKATSLASDISHGEQRQLEIAMALAMQPTMLLLDEPMAGMGKEETHQMIATLQRLKGDKTILLVEHDMDAVFNLADRVSVLDAGKIIATDSVSEIRNNAVVKKAYLGEDYATSE